MVHHYLDHRTGKHKCRMLRQEEMIRRSPGNPGKREEWWYKGRLLLNQKGEVYLLLVYPKNEHDNLRDEQKSQPRKLISMIETNSSKN